MQGNILFYSKKCIVCMKLMKAMKEKQLNKLFELVCVDDHNVKLPSYITHVPALCVSGGRKPLIMGDAIQWVSRVKPYKKPLEDNRIIGWNQTDMDNTVNVYANINGKNRPIRALSPMITPKNDDKKIRTPKQKCMVNDRISGRSLQDDTHCNIYCSEIKSTLQKYGN